MKIKEFLNTKDDESKACPACQCSMEQEYIASGEWWYLCMNPHCWYEGELLGQGGTGDE